MRSRTRKKSSAHSTPIQQLADAADLDYFQLKAWLEGEVERRRGLM
jgi:hypothetical protein